MIRSAIVGTKLAAPAKRRLRALKATKRLKGHLKIVPFRVVPEVDALVDGQVGRRLARGRVLRRQEVVDGVIVRPTSQVIPPGELA